MNRANKIVAMMLASAMAVPSVALAQTVTMTTTARVDLNVRAGPGPTFPVVTVITMNDPVIVYGCTEPVTWCDIEYDGVRGWVYAEYLVYQATPLPQAAQVLPPPVTFQGEAYWTQYYATQPFYGERDRWFGGTTGAAGGAVVGALIFGPIGAAVGAVVGGAAGAAVGEAITPPEEVIAFVRTQTPQPVFLEGEVVVGAVVPPVVTLNPVPNHPYSYAYINGYWVLTQPTATGAQIVYVIR